LKQKETEAPATHLPQRNAPQEEEQLNAPHLIPASHAPAPPNYLDSALAPWLVLDESLPGVMVKYLRIDLASGDTVSLLRMPSNTHLPRHRHTGPVTVYTLEGSWRYLEHEWVAQPGSLVWERAGSCHTPRTLSSESGAVVTLNMIHGDLEILNRRGKVVAVENGETALARQRRNAAAVASSAGKNNSMASSESVTSIGVPKTSVVLMNES